MELFLLHVRCFNLHPILQHVDVVCLSVHCRDESLTTGIKSLNRLLLCDRNHKYLKILYSVIN